MLRREQGWNLDSGMGDLWSWKKVSHGRWYVQFLVKNNSNT